MKRCYTELYALGRTIFLLFATWLSLARGDVTPSFLREPKTSQISQNVPVTIYCEVSPSDAMVDWLFDNKPLQPHQHRGLAFHGTNLYFKNFQYSSNEGMYQCVAATAAGSIISEPLVLRKPVLKPFPDRPDLNITATLNGVAVIPCPSVSSAPDSPQVFVKDSSGHLLDKTTDEYIRLPSGSIIITNVQHKHSGEYRCVAINSRTNTRQTAEHVINLSIQSQAAGSDTVIVDTDPENQEKILPWIGKSALLECPTVSSGEPQVTWKKYGGQLPQDRSRVEYGNLRIDNVKIQDAGTYICHGTSSSEQKFIALEVQELVSSTAVSSQVNATAGERVELRCNVIGRPEPKVTWYHNANQIARPSAVSNGGAVFVINKVAPSHTGFYQCQAKNNVSSDSAVMRLEVKGHSLDLNGKTALNIGQSQLTHTIASHLPYFTLWPTSLTARPLSNVAIPCLSVNAIETRWYRNGDPLDPAGPSHFDIAPSGSLQLFRVTVKDSGKYSCIAKNENGTASAHAYLTVLEETTMGVTASDRGANNETTNENTVETTKPRKKKKKNKHRKKKRRRKGKKRKNKRKKERKGKAKLVPPSRPNVEQLSDTSVMLNWTVPQNDGLPITFFRVQYKAVTPNKASWHTDDKEIDKDTTVYEVKNLKAGGTYKFRIAAVYSNNDNEVGLNSHRFEMKVAPAGKPHRPVDKPTLVEANPVQQKEHGTDVFGIGIRWQYMLRDTSPIEGFFIYYKPYDSKEQWKKVTILVTKVRSHVLTYLKPDTDYSIRMQCFNSAGESEYSNTVVRRTLAVERTSIFPTFGEKDTKVKVNREPEDKNEPDEDQSRGKIYDNDGESNTPTTQSSSEMLYMGIGIAMGVMLLLLIVFIVMCWWKQRQERRMMGMNGAIHAKFQDQAQRIYSESMRKKYMNGYPLNGLNGLVANGHVAHGNGSPGNKMNININPMSELETQMTNTQSGKGAPNHTLVPNGSVPHYSASDNNFNSINASKSRDEIPPDQPLLSERNGVPAPRDLPMSDPTVMQRLGSSSVPYSPNPGHSSEADLSSGETHSQTSPGLPGGCSYFSAQGGRHLQSFDGGTNPSVFSARNTMDSLSPSDHISGNHGKHKRRRKRPHSREHTTKDQATNTDLSSNEGTIEFTTFNKSPSLSSEKSQSFTNCATQCTDYSHMNGAL